MEDLLVNVKLRALLATTVGAALLLVPASAMAGKPPPKPPRGAPACVLSAGVSLTAVKSKGVVTGWLITGTTGTDSIDCSGSTSTSGVTINAGGGAADTVYGTPLADVINGQSFADGQFAFLFGLGGNDTIHAGWGTAGNSAHANVEGGPGDDTIVADGGTLYVLAGDGNDSLDLRNAWSANGQGEAGNDTILGSTNPDCNATTSCANALFGGAGNDVLTGGPGQDDVEGGPGTDEMHAGAGDDLLQDEGSGAEVFDCGDGIDGANDLDGNGVGDNGTGFTHQPEDDTLIGCEGHTVATAGCTYTPGTTGCIVLANVSITDSPSTATYVISGTVTFTPTCDFFAVGCDYSTVVLTGSGTFSVSGSQTASGTWTIPAPPNDRPSIYSPYSFTDAAGNATSCAAAVIRMVDFRFPMVASNGDTGGPALEVRTDDVGTTDVVGEIFSTGPLPTGLFRNPVDSQAGVTILC